MSEERIEGRMVATVAQHGTAPPGVDGARHMAELAGAREEFVRGQLRSLYWGIPAIVAMFWIFDRIIRAMGVRASLAWPLALQALFSLDRTLGTGVAAVRVLFVAAHAAAAAFMLVYDAPLGAAPVVLGAAVTFSSAVPRTWSGSAVLACSLASGFLSSGIPRMDHLVVSTLATALWLASVGWLISQARRGAMRRREAEEMGAEWDRGAGALEALGEDAKHITGRIQREDRHGKKVVLISGALVPPHDLGLVHLAPGTCRSCRPPARLGTHDGAVVETPDGQLTMRAGKPGRLAAALTEGDLRPALDELVGLPHPCLVVTEDWVELTCEGHNLDDERLFKAHRIVDRVRRAIVESAQGGAYR